MPQKYAQEFLGQLEYKQKHFAYPCIHTHSYIHSTSKDSILESNGVQINTFVENVRNYEKIKQQQEQQQQQLTLKLRYANTHIQYHKQVMQFLFFKKRT